MPIPRIDLYSDTQTRPSPAMRRAIAAAEVGDEQRGEDPTVNRLQEMVAELLGKERALFLPSGTMCNEIAYRVWGRPGEEIILDRTAHALHYETGAPAALSGLMTRPLEGLRGVFDAEMVEAAVRPRDSRHAPRSALVSIEQTSNLGGGRVWPVTRIEEVAEAARRHGLPVHMDGARLLNAVVASGVPARDHAASCDSVWIDLSKGLGCPVGAVLAGGSDFVEEAFRCKHLFGGAMRQAGIIAAAGVYALDNNVERLAEDHAHARQLGEGLAEISGLRIDPAEIETNMVYFEVDPARMTAPDFSARLLAQHGVRIGAVGPRQMRAVTHLDVAAPDIPAALRAMAAVLAA
ncbi:MAG: aminotransferase class I/II-fold pyridoxal phosphate-dependent enzyme [Rhodospirillales bacterium]|nr:aminotransferase class I/II-fold pyridoxal phosphate-dependent enzyme [Rhodospirillales bacterium]MDH3912913.1 aminotransferase class I/II-fold pyridoxal phosphate-dependent enzyme [Rhodospirillales bacterium]MDH3918808.1 aminotransferase class I/II-fold pyridoxal phosphate-dependent enzyme [Rhodospirillales bacterium]MDH3966064.1 aminotransferase class I/II-fold pyridoxal phosphate-dependent enzyme [Rhodospirillales bacterium]